MVPERIQCRFDVFYWAQSSFRAVSERFPSGSLVWCVLLGVERFDPGAIWAFSTGRRASLEPFQIILMRFLYQFLFSE